MLLVQCMNGWSVYLPLRRCWAPIPISAVNAALSTLMSPVTGGNPRSADRSVHRRRHPMVRSARSLLPEISAGVSSVTQKERRCDACRARHRSIVASAIDRRAILVVSVTMRLTVLLMLAPVFAIRNGSGWEAWSAARPWCATRHDPFTRSAVAVTSPAISVVLDLQPGRAARARSRACSRRPMPTSS